MTVTDRRLPQIASRTTTTLLATALLAVALLAGCNAGGKSNRQIQSSGGGGGPGRPDDPAPAPPSTETPIPPNATLVASAKKPAAPLAFTAKASGRVYLLDATDTKLKMNTAILKDQKIELDPAAGRVLLGGRELQKLTIDPEHFYELYYTPQ